MAKSYKVSVFAGTKVVADMAQQVKNATIEASLELKPIAGGATEATAVLLPVPNPLPVNSNRKRTKAIGWYKNATGPAWEAPKDSDNVNWWSYETGLWSLGSSVPLPKAKDGQGLLPLWDSSKVGGYLKDAQVRDANGVIYVSLKNTNTSPLSTKEDWGVVFNGAVSIVSNEEYLYAIVDSNNTILWGKRRDGSTYDIDFSQTAYTDSQIAILSVQIANIAQEITQVSNNLNALSVDYNLLKKSYSDKFSVISNEEYLYAIITPDNTLLWGIRKDGSVYSVDTSIWSYTNDEIKALTAYVNKLNVDINSKIDTEVASLKLLINSTVAELNSLKLKFNSFFPVISNEEYLYAIVDSNNTLLWGKRRDGSTYDVDDSLYKEISFLASDINLSVDTKISIVNKRIDDNEQKINAINSKISFFEVVSNPEFIEATTDKDGRLIEGIKTNGNKFIKSLEAERLLLSEQGISDLSNDLINSGFKSDTLDWSKSSLVRLPLTSVAGKINISMTTLPLTKTDNYKGTVEFWDFEGNYFKKPIILNAQGNSSMVYDKKNFTLDLDDGSKIQFGDWVVQDSFHLKAHYTDSLKVNNNVAYDIFETFSNMYPYTQSRVWSYTLGSSDTNLSGIGLLKNDFDTGARGFPDGFPVALYHNGAFYGIYMFNLKKHRDNYKMDRGNPEHVHLDGTLGVTTFFNGTNIDWTSFEIRNPNPRKKQEGWELLDIDGNVYNGDAPKELSNDGNSGIVKAKIIRLAQSANIIKANPSKQLFESYFANNWMFSDYLIMANRISNIDAFEKNWQWLSYDDKWTIAPYDWDGGLGVDHLGNIPVAPTSSIIGVGADTPMKFFYNLYKTDVELRYKELVEKKVIPTKFLFEFYKRRIDQIGYSLFEMENKKWKDMPGYRNSLLSEKWRLKNSTIVTSSINYNPNTEYTLGSEVVYGVGSERYVFIAKENVLGEPPLSDFYTSYPRTLGFYNSLKRVYKWLEDRENYTNSIFNL